jgi:hypothetical protein
LLWNQGISFQIPHRLASGIDSRSVGIYPKRGEARCPDRKIDGKAPEYGVCKYEMVE